MICGFITAIVSLAALTKALPVYAPICDVVQAQTAIPAAMTPSTPLAAGTYTLTADVANFTPGTPFTLTLTGPQFMGILMYAEATSVPGMIIGSFAQAGGVAPTGMQFTAACAGKAQVPSASITHTLGAVFNAAGASTSFMYTPPTTNDGPLMFSFAVVQAPGGMYSYYTQQYALILNPATAGAVYQAASVATASPAAGAVPAYVAPPVYVLPSAVSSPAALAQTTSVPVIYGQPVYVIPSVVPSVTPCCGKIATSSPAAAVQVPSVTPCCGKIATSSPAAAVQISSCHPTTLTSTVLATATTTMTITSTATSTIINTTVQVRKCTMISTVSKPLASSFPAAQQLISSCTLKLATTPSVVSSCTLHLATSSPAAAVKTTVSSCTLQLATSAVSSCTLHLATSAVSSCTLHLATSASASPAATAHTTTVSSCTLPLLKTTSATPSPSSAVYYYGYGVV